MLNLLWRGERLWKYVTQMSVIEHRHTIWKTFKCFSQVKLTFCGTNGVKRSELSPLYLPKLSQWNEEKPHKIFPCIFTLLQISNRSTATLFAINCFCHISKYCCGHYLYLPFSLTRIYIYRNVKTLSLSRRVLYNRGAL